MKRCCLLLGMCLLVGCNHGAIYPSDTNATTPTSPTGQAKTPETKQPTGNIPQGTGSGG